MVETETLLTDLFQSTPPVWGATCQLFGVHLQGDISIHAPRVGGDLVVALAVGQHRLISIHAPRVGGDCWASTCTAGTFRFQSTPPVWGATAVRKRISSSIPISIHAPRVGGDLKSISFSSLINISIHAPRVGGDTSRSGTASASRNFNPRPPCGGRLGKKRLDNSIVNISIHAPRVGGDMTSSWRLLVRLKFQSTPPVWGATISIPGTMRQPRNFNPRPPCGGRPEPVYLMKPSEIKFQSTPPVWGATVNKERKGLFACNFNPRPPCGGRLERFAVCARTSAFQSTPPVWGATPTGFRTFPGLPNFNPRPPCGGRQQKQLKIQAVLVKNRQFLQISSPNSYPILKNKVASLQIILQNLVRDLCDFLRAYVSHLKHQYIFWVVGCLYSKMLDLVFIAVSQVIKTKTVLFRVHDLTQLCL